MKWSEFKNMVDSKLQEQLINGVVICNNPDILYIDFNESITPQDIDGSGMGLMIIGNDK